MVSMSFITIFEKKLLYDRYTLPDTYEYRNSTRTFQWDKILIKLNELDSFTNKHQQLAILNNYKNRKGEAPHTLNYKIDYWDNITDSIGTPRYHSVPLFSTNSFPKPEIYGRDGSLVAIKEHGEMVSKVTFPNSKDEWLVHHIYIEQINHNRFNKIIIVDITNQNIATLERINNRWQIRSMNPATTGIDMPPYRRATPLGIYVVHDKRYKMHFVIDGTSDIAGFAPYATRFSGGGYIHGIPVNIPSTKHIEYSSTLGTKPRSHKCVRSATSHAKFIYDWCDLKETIVIVID